MRRLLPLVTLALTPLILTGCGNGPPDVGQAVSGGSASEASVVTNANPKTTVMMENQAFKAASITVGTGDVVGFMNMDQVPHNVTFDNPGHDSTTMSDNDTFEVRFTSPGDYHYRCTFHPGMEGTVKVTGNAVQAADNSGGGDQAAQPTMSAAQMDAAMQASIKAFPAKTAGQGAQPLQPKLLADGTKQFELTAEVVQWEVSPGKKVSAWTYNGTVPGPAIQVNIGDRVQVVLHNHLPESTTIHFHGIQTPNDMDGTPFVTQDPVQPGKDFTYSFTPNAASVGMYHSHDDAVNQMPDGMFGPIFVGNLPVPAGVSVTGGNQPFMLDDSGTIGMSFNGKSFPATAPYTAKVGQWLEVTYFNAGSMDHPIHLHEFPQLVIAKDGHPLPQPYEADTVLVGPGERYTVLINANIAGTWVWHCHILSHAETQDGMYGMVTALVVS